jgi:hypothetical protein
MFTVDPFFTLLISWFPILFNFLHGAAAHFLSEIISHQIDLIFRYFNCRVSFGSSKGSMVETLVFETPTPLPEHAEREFFSPAMTASASAATTNNVNGLNDSGIELQEE